MNARSKLYKMTNKKEKSHLMFSFILPNVHSDVCFCKNACLPRFSKLHLKFENMKTRLVRARCKIKVSQNKIVILTFTFHFRLCKKSSRLPDLIRCPLLNNINSTLFGLKDDKKEF